MPTKSAECRYEGCAKPADGGKSYCRRHYGAWKRGQLPKARYKTCHVEGCRKRIARRGRCDEHAARDFPGKSAASDAAPEQAPTEAAPEPAAEPAATQ